MRFKTCATILFLCCCLTGCGLKPPVNPNDTGGSAVASQPVPSGIPAPTQSKPAGARSQTIKLGQTKDMVIAGFGKPMRIAKHGVREVYYYRYMRVTFTNGKVSKVE
ncbi:MAG: hypothetical protein ABSC77_06845 [Terracidiphilus sp.]